MSQPFTIKLDLALSGPGAVPAAGYEAALKEAGNAISWLKDQKLELLDIVDRTDDIDQAKVVSDGAPTKHVLKLV